MEYPMSAKQSHHPSASISAADWLRGGLLLLGNLVQFTAIPVRKRAVTYFEDGVSHGACGYLHQPLYDSGHALAGADFTQDPAIIHVLLYVQVGCTVLYYVSPFNHSYFIHELSYPLAIWGTLLIFKAATQAVTLVPSPLEECRSTDASYIGSAGFGTACNDMMFSGHTTSYLMLWFILYEMEASQVVLTGGALYVAIAITLTILTRQHYSVDCLVAMALTGLSCIVWRQYRSYHQNPVQHPHPIHNTRSTNFVID